MLADFKDFLPDPREWATANHPMTSRQAAYLEELAKELGFDFEPRLTKADASRQISISHRLNAMPSRNRETAKNQAAATQSWERLSKLTERIEDILARRAGEPIDAALRRAKGGLSKLRVEAEQYVETGVGLWIGLALARASSLYQRAWSDLSPKR